MAKCSPKRGRDLSRVLENLLPTCGEKVACHILLCARDHLDVPVICLPRRRAPGDQSVIHEDDPRRALVESRGHIAAQRESRPTIGHGGQRVAEHIADRLLSPAVVRQGQDGVGMRVQHGRGRDERVQQRLDRRARPAGIEQALGEIVDHLLIRHLLLALAQRRDVIEAHRRKLFGHDGLHVAAAALDVHHIDGVAEEIAAAELEAVVAPAPQHERLFLADKARLIDELLEPRRGRFGPAVAHSCDYFDRFFG